MSGIEFAIFGATAVSVGVAVLTAATLPALCLLAKRRVEKLEAEQAEMAAFVASELKRHGRLLARQRASAITESMARARRLEASKNASDAKGAASTNAIHQPLRKTIH